MNTAFSRSSMPELSSPSASPAGSGDARLALELLLELGVRTLDGDRSARTALPSALHIAKRRLAEHHLRRQAFANTQRSLRVAQRARQRSQDDVELLVQLEKAVAAPSAQCTGRDVVVACLSLLENLALDERVASHAPCEATP